MTAARLGDVASAYRGISFAAADAAPRPFERSVPCLTTAAVKPELEWSSARHIAETLIRDPALFVRPGDILVSTTNSREKVGSSAAIKDVAERTTFGAFVTIVRPASNILPDYLAHWMRSPQYFEQIKGHIRQTTGFANLNTSALLGIHLPVPLLKEQRRIAARLTTQLTTVARTVALMKREAETCDDLIESALRWSLTKQEDELTLGSGLVEVASGVGSDWFMYPVYGSTRDGIAPAREGVGKHPERYKLVEPGTIFYNPMRILIGSVSHLSEGKPPGITSPDYVVMRTRPELLDDRWFYEWLRSWRGEALIRSLARGAVRERMLFRRLAPATIAVPPIARQREAAKIIGRATHLRIEVDNQLGKAKLLPRSILSTAFQNST